MGSFPVSTLRRVNAPLGDLRSDLRSLEVENKWSPLSAVDGGSARRRDSAPLGDLRLGDLRSLEVENKWSPLSAVDGGSACLVQTPRKEKKEGQRLLRRPNFEHTRLH